MIELSDNSELHLFIIWEKARDKEEIIKQKIVQRLEIVDIYDVKWSQKKFSENLTRFYGENLPDGSNKEKHIGSGEFLLVIVMDHNPNYHYRDTSKGKKLVNINIFDLKQELREITGGGHKIHSTNSLFETNHDLCLLLRSSVSDYVGNIKSFDGVIKNIEKDLVGCNGWDSLEQFFYVLNNTTNYVVLRNFECLPEKPYEEEHGDIDILCDNIVDIRYITNAKKIFPQDHRVHYSVKINQQEIKFDFRFVGDNYYDANFQSNILKNKILHRGIFYKPSDSDYFYSLIYHASIHKGSISEDYFNKIKVVAGKYDQQIKINDRLSIYKILEEYIKDSDYVVTKPKDCSVYFNANNAHIGSLLVFLKNKLNLSSIESFLGDKWGKDIFHMLYFIGYRGKEKFFIKVGNLEIGMIDREIEVIKFLSSESINIPKMVDNFKYKNFSILVLEFIDGKSLDTIIEEGDFDKESVCHLISSIRKIIKVLHRRNLIHRDITPNNLILSNEKLFLIDYSFVLDKNSTRFPELSFVEQNIKSLSDLGGIYKVKSYTWDDVISCEKIIKIIYPSYKLHFLKDYLFFLRKRRNIRINYKGIGYTLLRSVVKVTKFIARISRVNIKIVYSFKKFI